LALSYKMASMHEPSEPEVAKPKPQLVFRLPSPQFAAVFLESSACDRDGCKLFAVPEFNPQHRHQA
jgi:hypothetical protein